jgi:NADPH-dependent ferric siderophore reductase
MTTDNISTPASAAVPDRTPRRVRHEVRFRILEVLRVTRVTPHLVRVTLGGDELEGFTSLGFDDHVKLFFPDATGALPRPVMGPDGLNFPGGRPPMRDYTPRSFDAAARTLDIEFAVHEAGPATDWAVRAKAGDKLGVGGPRGSFVIPMNFDGYVLIGDDTALPAIARRLGELPAGAKVAVLAEVDSAADELTFETNADLTVHWVHRNGTGNPLPAALRAAQLPAGDIYTWVACESGVAKELRAILVGEKQINKAWVKAAGYWRRGAVATHDTHED